MLLNIAEWNHQLTVSLACDLRRAFENFGLLSWATSLNYLLWDGCFEALILVLILAASFKVLMMDKGELQFNGGGEW